MYSRRCLTWAMVLGLAMPGWVLGQGRDERDGRGQGRGNDRGPSNGQGRGQGQDRGAQPGRGPEQGRPGGQRPPTPGSGRGYQDPRPGQYPGQYQGEPGRGEQRGAGPNHSFYRGGRLPYAYQQPRYVVDDWRSHRLSAPPRGMHWVQSGNDYLLVAIATGVIVQLLLSQ